MNVSFSRSSASVDAYGFAWWKTEPRNDLVAAGKALCLAEPGKQYAAYLPSGGAVTLTLKAGTYRAFWFNPRTGKTRALPDAQDRAGHPRPHPTPRTGRCFFSGKGAGSAWRN